MSNMSEKLHLHFLILSSIFYEGIIATLPDKDTRESSVFLVRNRRVINHSPAGIYQTRIEDANYIVSIPKNNGPHCAGSILSHYTVITAAACVSMHISNYRVFSGQTYEKRGNIHELTSKDVYHGNTPHQLFEGIALITVDPPFVFNARTGFIDLYEGPLTTGTQVTVRGWGCRYLSQPGPRPASRGVLRTISLPIMNHEECRNVYRVRFAITEKHVCTYDAEQYCAHTDAGAPLIVNNKLAGIHVWKGEIYGQRNPDVYINFQRDQYSAWIRRNSILM